METGTPADSAMTGNLTTSPGATLLTEIQTSPIRILLLSNRYKEKLASEILLLQRFSAVVSLVIAVLPSGRARLLKPSETRTQNGLTRVRPQHYLRGRFLGGRYGRSKEQD